MKKKSNDFYVVNFFSTPIPNYSEVIKEQSKKKASNPIYEK